MSDKQFRGNIPDEVRTRGQNAGIGGERIALPFAALKLYWHNGDKRLQQVGGVPYFGGWRCPEDDFETFKAESGLEPPAGFQKVAINPRQGQPYDAYITRAIGFAVIIRRLAWFTNPTTGKDRTALNILGYLAEYDKTKKMYVPWGLTVLSSSSFSGIAIETALKKFENLTAKARKEFAGNYPAWYFFVALGTFGKTPLYEEKGKVQKSTITPCDIYIPKEITVDVLNSFYVGDDIAAVMDEARSAALEWADSWNKRPTKRLTETATEPGYEPGEPDQDIPF